MTMESGAGTAPGCKRAREWIQERVDGNLSAASRRILDDHLDGCADCREYSEEIARVHDALNRLPSPRLPADALERVWARTVDAGETSRSRWSLPFGLRPALAAAAAVIVLVAVGWFGLVREMPPAGPDPEVARAAEEARYVLELTAKALRRSERAAMQGVLAGQVTPALERIVIDLPATPGAAKRRNGV
jgi:anti-sigma factor RsiW